MRTQATAKFVRVSSRKAGLVLELIRGKPVAEALAILEYTPRMAARLIEKVLRSAVANAEHNHQVRNLDDLTVVDAVANGGPSMKRVQPRAMGRAFFIRHRTSHLTVAVSDEANGGRPPLTRPRHWPVREPVPAPAATAAPAPAPAARAAKAPARRAPAARGKRTSTSKGKEKK